MKRLSRFDPSSFAQPPVRNTDIRGRRAPRQSKVKSVNFLAYANTEFQKRKSLQ
jgi:hypothetical protein